MPKPRKPSKKSKFPSDVEIDTVLLEIMDGNLFVYEDKKGIICNRFATASKIRKYIHQLIKTAKKNDNKKKA